jgi:hypothetical protein
VRAIAIISATWSLAPHAVHHARISASVTLCRPFSARLIFV